MMFYRLSGKLIHYSLFSYFSWILIFFADFSASSLLSGTLGSFIYFFPDWKEFRGKKKNPLQIFMLKSFSKKSEN